MLNRWVTGRLGCLIPTFLMTMTMPGLSCSEEPLRLAQTILIPGISGRLDHMAIDVEGGRLFVAGIESNSVEVIDVRAGRWIRSLPDFRKPQGLFYARGLHRLFVANGTDGTCRTLDGKTLALIHTEPLSLGADLMDYDSRARQIYVGHGGKDAGNDYGELSVINAQSGARVSTLRVNAHPGAILVSSGRDVFVTVPDTAQILTVDRKTHAIEHTWTVAGGVRTVSLALDEHAHRLLVGTRNPAFTVILDTGTGKEMSRTPTVNTLDGLYFDASHKRAYASGGEGFVDVQRQVDADHYESVGHVPTGANARTSLFVPELHRLFVAVPKATDHSAELQVFEVPH